jgi:hypothetical protein
MFHTEERLIKRWSDLNKEQKKIAVIRWPHTEEKQNYIFQVRDCDDYVLFCRLLEEEK